MILHTSSAYGSYPMVFFHIPDIFNVSLLCMRLLCGIFPIVTSSNLDKWTITWLYPSRPVSSFGSVIGPTDSVELLQRARLGLNVCIGFPSFEVVSLITFSVPLVASSEKTTFLNPRIETMVRVDIFETPLIIEMKLNHHVMLVIESSIS